MRTLFKTRLVLTAVLSVTSSFAQTINATSSLGPDGYPNRPVTIIVPFAPGGGSDNVARLIAARLTEKTGASFVIDNKPGGGTNIGNDFAAKARKDGYTLLLAQTTLSINPSLYKSISYDVKRDLSPVAHIANSPTVLIANSNFPAKNVQELIAAAKTKPDSINYGSGGKGTSVHLAGELFSSLTGAVMTHVPYRGSAPAMTDLIGGQIQIMFDTAPSALGQIKGGKVKALAVTGGKRLADIPNVPTFSESGLPALDAPAWYGVMSPSGVPANIVQFLNTQIESILKEPETVAKLLQIGAFPVGGSADQFAKFIANESERWSGVIRKNNISAD